MLPGADRGVTNNARHQVAVGAHGLKGSAAKAIKFSAELDVRLPNQRVLLTPARGMYQANKAKCFDSLPLLWGTHIGFAFTLERA